MNAPKPDSFIRATREITAPYDIWVKQPTPENMSRVVSSLDPVINKAVTTYATGNVSPVVRGRARVLAMKAVRSFNPSRGAVLNTHIMGQLRPLARYARQAASSVKLSERKLLAFNDLHRIEEDFYDRNGRDPSDVELSDLSGLSNMRISKLRNYMSPIVSSHGAQDSTLGAPITSRTDPNEVWLDYVYYDLDNVSRKILDWKLGRNGNPRLRNEEIAIKLKMTPSAISQRLSNIEQKLIAKPRGM